MKHTKNQTFFHSLYSSDTYKTDLLYNHTFHDDIKRLIINPIDVGVDP